MKIKPSDDTDWRNQNGDFTYRLNYPLNNKSVVVDLGARHGNWSDLIRQRYDSKIYCFEAVNNFCKELENKNYNTFCFAVSDKKQKIRLGVFESEASIFYNESSFEVDSISASEIFDVIKEEKIDLLKINVEGSEYPILNNLIDSGKINMIENIQVQFHLFDGVENQDYDTLVKKLSKTHKLTWRFPFVWENWTLNKK
jgi:FkbM family methyltransferase